jgi:poly-gamma-glutamate capsule biosynthesis protein CapA/YwtB (metallophosphatase superfamily)
MYYWKRYLFIILFLVSSACQANPSEQILAESPSATGYHLLTSTGTETKPASTITRVTPSATFTPEPSPTETPIPPSATTTPTATETPITTLLFTGVIVPARCVQAALDEIGDANYPYEEVSELISGADLAIGTFNATMSDQVEHTGCIWTYQLVGSPDNADAMAEAGFDLLSVATNHIKDCGIMKSWCDYSFFDTLENIRRVGILPVGAGKDLDEALEPAVVTVNGVRFGFVSLGDSKLSPVVFAGEDHPGIAQLSEENMRKAVARARREADVVIALPHWGSEDIIVPNWWQRDQAKYTVAAGADLVVGNHTHVVQAYQELDGVMVFYGLGNFVFDQGLRDHRQGVILLVHFAGTEFAGYELIPTHVDPDGRVHIADAEEAAEVLERVQAANQWLR